MTKKLDIQILVVNHKQAYIPKNDLLKPIQVGVALHGNKLAGMSYYDNDGDNISNKNQSYCELTATYYAWKNIEADYYGQFHYRRYLSFVPETSDNPYPGKAYANALSMEKELNLNEAAMRKIIEANDLVIPRKDNTKTTSGHASLYEQYCDEHFQKDLDVCLDYVRQKYPKIAPSVDCLQDSWGYFCNMFIMKKELFHEYSAFVFDVLNHFDKTVDISSYNPRQYRVDGFLAERLTDIFIHYIQSQNKYKIKELQVAYFENTDPEPSVEPVASENNIGIVLAANDYYIPYMSTLIHSIVAHASNDYIYDINIFHQNITPRNQQLLIREFAHQKNISIRFCNMRSRADEYKKLFTKWHFTVETYFRLFIQDIMAKYKKVLYLDGDMIVKHDVAELYNTNLEGYLLAATRDLDMAGVYTSNLVGADDTIEPKRKNYIDNVLKIKDPYGYFQAGVIVFNLEEMRKSFDVQKALKFAASKRWEYLDQDVLNYFAQGQVKYLDQTWNVLYDWNFWRISNVISKAPIKLYEGYMESRKNPKIIHYGGTIKPWQQADCDFSEEYWPVARQSAFYELILSRMAVWSVQHSRKDNGSEPKVDLLHRTVHKARHLADKVAPKGTLARKPLTATSRLVKRALGKR